MHDSWFFVGIFVFIFLIWIATGGPLHPIAFSGPTLNAPGALGGGTYLSLPKSPFTVGGSNVSLPGSTAGNTVSGSASDLTAFGVPSPYRGIVTMSHGVWGAGGDAQREYVQLSVSSSATVPVDLSGWKLESGASGGAVILPKGTEIPNSGTINAAQDMILTAGDRAIVVSGRSPIGASFRENKCIGYFSTFQTFYPALPQTCPVPSAEYTSFYGGDTVRDPACTTYVNTLSRCQVTLSPPSGLSGACQSFLIQHLNYNGCVQAHQQDADFKGNEWRVYLGRIQSLWNAQHDVVRLLDASGKTVDAFSY